MAERDKWGRIPATLIEIDQTKCALRWGEGDCPASGSAPCFNTLSTCQAPDSYDPSGGPLTLRFSENRKSSQLPATIGCVPSLLEARNRPAELSVGGTNENISALGSRDELLAAFKDHPYSDLLTDPYRHLRPYDPEKQGTFWGKWEARNKYRQGFPVRKISGYELEDGSFEALHTYHYLLESVAGPSAKGHFTIKAYDILQALRTDRAVFPAPSPGRLSSPLTETGTSMTLQPVGVGAEYPTGSFRVRIGGEGMDVSRSGDNLNVITRGLYGGAESHAEDDTVQVVARFQSKQIQTIAYQIITGALPELASYIDAAKWDSLAGTFLPRLYSADITEPTGVEDLLAELTQTAPIYFYADVRKNKIEFEVIRKPSQVAIELDEHSALIADSVDVKEYPKERIDEVWVYYRIRDAAADIDKEENYSQRFILVNPVEQARRGRRSIKRIFSRWIVSGARDTAEEIATAYISRFENSPIKISFDLDARKADVWLGDVAKLLSRQKQDVYGDCRRDLNYQIIKAHELEGGHQFRYLAQSYEFFDGSTPGDPGGGDPGDPGVEDITITIQPEDTTSDGTVGGAVDQIDLRELYNSTVAPGFEVPNITFVVAGGPAPAGGTNVGAATSQTWSLANPNNWPWNPSITLRVEAGGVVAGRGGNGGDSKKLSGGKYGPYSVVANATPGAPGQTGFKTLYPVTINNLGIIGGGGGGGGGSAGNVNSGYEGCGGGGGAGLVPGGPGYRGRDLFYGTYNAYPQSGSILTGGNGTVSSEFPGLFYGGKGGDLGQSGGQGATTNGGSHPGGYGAAGGAPGAAVDGIAFVTYAYRGDIRGSEI